MEGFETLASYDKPRLVAEMVLDNEVTMRGIQRALFGPEKLSIQEREGAVARLKEAAGGTGIGNALIDIATNPFVWAGVAFSGLHANRLDAAIKGGRPIFAPKMAGDALHREYDTALGALNLLTGWQALEGSAVGMALDQGKQTIDRLAMEDSRVLGPALKEIHKDMGLPNRANAFDPRTYAKDSPLRRKLEDFHNAFHVWGSSMDQTLDRRVAQGRMAFVKELPNGSLEKMQYPEWTAAQKELRQWRRNAEAGDPDPFSLHYFVEETGRWNVHDADGRRITDHAVVTPEALTEKLRTTGADKLVAAWKEVSGAHLRRNLGVDGAPEFVVDPQKVHQALKGAVGHDLMAAKLSGAHIDTPPETLEGIDLISELFGANQERAIAKGWVSADHRADLLKGLYQDIEKEDRFLPLNVTERVRPGGGRMKVETDRTDLMQEASGRLLPRTRADVVYTEEDLLRLGETFQGGLSTGGGMGQLRRRWAKLADAKGPEGVGQEYVVHRMQPWQATDRYLKDMGQVYAARIEPLNDEVAAELNRTITTHPRAEEYRHSRAMKQSSAEAAHNAAQAAGHPYGATPSMLRPAALYGVPLDQIPVESLPGHAKHWKQAFSIADAVQMSHDLMESADLKSDLREVIIPAVMARGNMGHIISNASWNGARKSARWFVDGPLGKYLEKNGHADWIQRWREALDENLPLTTGGGLSHAAAKFLYTTHLGFNLGSVVLNMFQPLVLGGTMLGPTAVLQGYGRAIKEMLDYTRERVTKHGLGPITDAQRLELMDKNFKFMGRATVGRNVLNIGPNPLSIVDTAMMSRAGMGERTGFMDRFFEYSMKMFEKSEWLNRNTMAHAAEARFARAGRSLDPYTMGQISRVVEESQYPAGKLDQPLLFLNNRFMSNPLIRQFFTYNLRAFTTGFHVLPRMLEQNYGTGLVSSMARGMGISAVMYEVGKNVLGADISHGLYADSVTSVVGGGRVFEKDQSPVPLPPVLDIPLNLARGLAGGDMDLIGRSVSRMIPGGVALSRALGVLPKSPVGSLGLQRTYADWSAKTPEGLVPIYKSDGSLMDYRPGSDLILRSVGADLGKWQQPGELDHYLTQIREEALAYRHQYLQALKSNNIPRSKVVAAEFEKRFKLPLTVTSAQVKQSIQLSEVPRAERALNRMPKDQRAVYSRVVQRARTEREMGLPEGALTQYGSAAERAGLRHHPVEMDEKTQELIRQLTQPAAPFAPFVP